MTKIWEHVFEKSLKVNPAELKAVVLTEAPLQKKTNRMKMAEIMFENFQVKNIFVGFQAELALMGAGRTTGLVVDSGAGVSHTVPIYDGFSIPHAIRRIDLAGRALTDWMAKLLHEHLSQNFSSSSEIEQVKSIKMEHCKIAPTKEAYRDIIKSSSAEHNSEYEFPDKRKLTLNG